MSTSTTGLEEFQLFIGRNSVPALSGATFESENPYAQRPWARLADGGPADVDVAVASTRAPFDGEWGQMSGFERASIVRKVDDGSAANAERLARLEVNPLPRRGPAA